MNFRPTLSAAVLSAALASMAGAQTPPQPPGPAGVKASSGAIASPPGAPHLPGIGAIPTPPPMKPRFPAAEDWKNYGASLAASGDEDLSAAAKAFSGKAAAGKDQVSVAGLTFLEAFALSLNSSDKAAARKAVLDCAFTAIKKPGEDPKNYQKNVAKFFEDRGSFGSASSPLAAFERYKALLAQKSDEGAVEQAKVPLSAGVLAAIAQIKRSDEQDKAIQDFFVRAKAELQAEAARLQPKKG